MKLSEWLKQLKTGDSVVIHSLWGNWQKAVVQEVEGGIIKTNLVGLAFYVNTGFSLGGDYWLVQPSHD